MSVFHSSKVVLFFFNVLTISQGAYTGVCSSKHVPPYKDNIEKFKAKGIDSVVCVAINDPYTMNAWAEKLQAKDAVSVSLYSILTINKGFLCFLIVFLSFLCLGISGYFLLFSFVVQLLYLFKCISVLFIFLFSSITAKGSFQPLNSFLIELSMFFFCIVILLVLVMSL